MSIYEIKGADLEYRVREVLEVFFQDDPQYTIVPKPMVIGQSGTTWRLDAGVRNNRTNSYSVLVECKGIGKPKAWQYHAQICSAYMELNDVRVNNLFADAKLYLIINRRAEIGDQQAYRKNYEEIFKAIDVRVYYFADDQLVTFATDLSSMREGNGT